MIYYDVTYIELFYNESSLIKNSVIAPERVVFCNLRKDFIHDN